MTRIVLCNPGPKKYSPSEMHELVCARKKDWSQIPDMTRMRHSREASAVSSLAWFYHDGQDSVEKWAAYYGVSVESVHALAKVLGITRLSLISH